MHKELMVEPSNKIKVIVEVWSVKLISILVAIAGLINMISAIFPAMNYRYQILHRLFSGQTLHAARIITVLAGFFLLIIALSLWRKKQIAWVLAMAILVVAIIGNLLKGIDFEEASYMTAILLVLLYLRPHFQAKSDPPSFKSGVYTFIFSLIFVFLYGTIGFYYIDRHFLTHNNFISSVIETFKVIFLIDNSKIFNSTRFGQVFINSIPTVALVTSGYSLYKIFQPVATKNNSQEEKNIAANIIRRFGDSSLATFALLSDKTFFIFKNTVISYRVVGRTAIALGDPIGKKEDFQKIVEEFIKFCTINDWRPVFYQTQDKSVYLKNGLAVITIGQDALIDLKYFSLDGHEKKKLRNVKNRLSLLGFYTEVLNPPLDYWDLEELRSVSDEWLMSRNGHESGFSLGYFDDDYLRNSLVMIVRDQNKNICAFANIIVNNQKNGIAIDLMRRRFDCDNGIMEFLFTELFLWAKKQEYTFCDLGLSPLADIGNKKDDPLDEKFLKTVYQNANMFYNFKGLYFFKEKFKPIWSERYVAYARSISTLAAAAAIVKAHRFY